MAIDVEKEGAKVQSVVFGFSNVDFGWLERSAMVGELSAEIAECVVFLRKDKPNVEKPHWRKSEEGGLSVEVAL